MIIADENELAGMLHDGPPQWIAYFTGNLAAECQLDGPDREANRALRAWTWGKHLLGEASLAQRREGEAMVYLIRRNGK